MGADLGCRLSTKGAGRIGGLHSTTGAGGCERAAIGTLPAL